MDRWTRFALIGCLVASAAFFGCSEDGSSGPPPGGNDGDADGDGDGDGDSDTDTDTDTDADGDSPMHPDDLCDAGRCSYIWIANSGESTLSKVNTFTEREVARYRTCPGDGPFDCDPSRTSVNLHGDVVVTNRFPSSAGGQAINPETLERSSVTKFAAARGDCVDRNQDGFITTSTGPTDVLPWGADECMLWNQDLGDVSGNAPRARATAWDGTEDPDTGVGGNVIIGTCIAGAQGEWDQVDNNTLFVMNGDTGAIEDRIVIPNTECFYGGAMDPNGNFWIMDGFGFPSATGGGGLIRVNLDTRAVDRFEEQCGYGISVDADGNVWTGGKHFAAAEPPNFDSCVQKLDLSGASPVITITTQYAGEYFRGIAVGSGVSDGYVWAAERKGALYRINRTDLTDVQVIETPAYNAASACPDYDNCPNNLVGVAIDYEGHVWSVSTTDDAAYRYDPTDGSFATVPIGESPYTYSDMTGMQLQGVIVIE